MTISADSDLLTLIQESLSGSALFALTLVLLNKKMPHPFQILSQSDYLIQIVDINSHTEWQTVQIQISWQLV